MYVYNTGSEVERRSPLLLLFPPLSSSEFLTFHQAGEPRETQFAHSWDGEGLRPAARRAFLAEKHVYIMSDIPRFT